MAHDGSCWASAVNAFTVSGKKNECSIATARLNCVWAAALQEIGKLTSPNFSSWARVAGWARKIASDHTKIPREIPMRDMALSSVRFSQTISATDMSNAFIVPFPMQNCYQTGMNFKHLRAFVTVADAGGFARAANRLNLSQPALSRQIRAMEIDLSVRLFDRIGR